jgi:hypothetical protein
MIIDPRAEIAATKSLLALQEAAERCREAYERAHMGLPEPLKRFLGLMEPAPAEKPKPAVSIPEPDLRRPPGSHPDWFSVPLVSATPTSTALAVLRESGGGPLRAGLVTDRVLALLPNSSSGSVANVGTKLTTEGLIERTDEGWRLTDSSKAPVLFEGRLWGPPAAFGKYEIAAYRREVVLHLLRLAPTGLQTTQVVEQLRQCPWLVAPVNKEVVQDDIEVLRAEKRIRRRGASKKWELAPEKGKEGTDAP